MSFFTLNGIPLRVETDKNVSVTNGLNINTTKLRPNDLLNSATHFHNAGYTGVEFKITIFLKETDLTPDGESVINVLSNLINTMTAVSIVTEAIDVPNGKYIVTSQSMDQDYKKSTHWTLKFVQVYSTKTYTSTAYKKSKTTSIKSSKTTSSLNSKLKKCSLPLNTKSKGACVKYLEKKLYQKGFLKKKFINNTYDKNTATAVKKLQKKYKKKYNLKVTGVVDKKTRNCLLKI